MTRWNGFNRREFLSTALGAEASFSILLTYVDIRTKKRTIKDSGHWYAKLASTGSLTY